MSAFVFFAIAVATNAGYYVSPVNADLILGSDESGLCELIFGEAYGHPTHMGNTVPPICF